MFKNSLTLRISTIGMMSALYIVLYAFKIPLAPESRVSLTFLPIVAAGYLLDPVAAMLTGIIGDVVGSLLFPQGAYFFGFTVSAAVNGLIYGLFFFRAKKRFILRAIISNFLSVVIISLFLNTLWASMLYGKAFWVCFWSRVIKNIVVFPIQTILSIFIVNLLNDTGISVKYIKK